MRRYVTQSCTQSRHPSINLGKQKNDVQHTWNLDAGQPEVVQRGSPW